MAGWAARRAEAQAAAARGEPLEAVKIAMREMKAFADEHEIHALPIETKAFFADPRSFSPVFKGSGASAAARRALSEILAERGLGFLQLEQPLRALGDLEAARDLLEDTGGGAPAAVGPRLAEGLARARLAAGEIQARERRAKEATKVPVTILTGFLGAGKTTLLNHILRANHGMKFAIIENEVGQVGIDNQLIQDASSATKTEETITVLDNGCLCCTVRSDLIDAIQRILRRADAQAANLRAGIGEQGRAPLDGILIETTGLADPGPVIKTFYAEEELLDRTKINGVLTVVDACHFLQQVRRSRSAGAVNESAQQVGFADRLLLNKVDAVDGSTLEQVEASIRSINELCSITRCSLSQNPWAVDLPGLLAAESFSLDRVLDELGATGAPAAPPGLPPLPKRARIGPGALDVVRSSFSPKSRHDSDIGTFTVTLEGAPLVLERFTEVMNSLRAEKAVDLYRYKGIVCVREPGGATRRAVLQGVHDLCLFEPRGPWPPEATPKSQIVFIGRSLDRELYGRLFEKTKEGALGE